MTIASQESMLSAMPFAIATGIELVEAKADRVRGRLAWAPERCTAGGVLHGGALMTLADSIGALSAFLNLPPGASTSTIESKTNFFRAVRAGAVHATAEPVHVGRMTIVVQTDLTDDEDRLVARVTQTQAVIASSGERATPRRTSGAGARVERLDIGVNEQDIGA